MLFPTLSGHNVEQSVTAAESWAPADELAGAVAGTLEARAATQSAAPENPADRPGEQRPVSEPPLD